MGKSCPKCKALDATFGLNKARKDGLQTYCLSCMAYLRKLKQYDKKRWITHKEYEQARSKQYRLDNLEIIRAKDRENALLRRFTHAAEIRAHNITRKHGIAQATPLWANRKEMNCIYSEAKNLTQRDGIERHVDHVIPLKHSLVCGLHVEFNMQILTAAENMQKHNCYEVNI